MSASPSCRGYRSPAVLSSGGSVLAYDSPARWRRSRGSQSPSSRSGSRTPRRSGLECWSHQDSARRVSQYRAKQRERPSTPEAEREEQEEKQARRQSELDRRHRHMERRPWREATPQRQAGLGTVEQYINGIPNAQAPVQKSLFSEPEMSTGKSSFHDVLNNHTHKGMLSTTAPRFHDANTLLKLRKEADELYARQVAYHGRYFLPREEQREREQLLADSGAHKNEQSEIAKLCQGEIGDTFNTFGDGEPQAEAEEGTEEGREPKAVPETPEIGARLSPQMSVEMHMVATTEGEDDMSGRRNFQTPDRGRNETSKSQGDYAKYRYSSKSPAKGSPASPSATLAHTLRAHSPAVLSGGNVDHTRSVAHGLRDKLGPTFGVTSLSTEVRRFVRAPVTADVRYLDDTSDPRTIASSALRASRDNQSGWARSKSARIGTGRMMRVTE